MAGLFSTIEQKKVTTSGGGLFSQLAPTPTPTVKAEKITTEPITTEQRPLTREELFPKLDIARGKAFPTIEDVQAKSQAEIAATPPLMSKVKQTIPGAIRTGISKIGERGTLLGEGLAKGLGREAITGGISKGLGLPEGVQLPEEQRLASRIGRSPITGELTGAEKATETTGKVVGTIGKEIAKFAAAGKIASGIKLLQGISNPFVRNLVVDQAIDNIAQTPFTIAKGVGDEKTGLQIAGDVAKQNAIDALINVTIGGAGEAIKGVKKGVKVGKELTEEAAETGIRRGIGGTPLVPEIPKKPFSEQLIGDIQQQFKPLTEPKKPFGEKIVSGLSEEFAPKTVAQDLRKFRSEGVLKPKTDITGLKPKITPEVPPVLKQQELGENQTITKVLTETPTKIKPNIADRAERAYQEIFATNIPFEKIGGKAKTQGSNLNRVQGTIEYNTVGKQTNSTGDEIGKSIVDIFSDVPKESKKELFDYILNKHNIDRFREGKPVFGSSVTSDISSKAVSDIDLTNPTFKTKQQEVTKYFNNLMNEWGVKSGLVSDDTAKMLKERYPNYVPTYRAMDLPKSMTQGSQNIAQIIKKAKGSGKAILPIDQQMIALTDRTIKNAKKNELMNTVADAFEAGDSNANRYIKEIKDLPKKEVGDLLDVGKNFDETPVLKGDEYAVNFYTDGEPRQMIVNKTLYKALEDVRSDDAINKVAVAVKKYATQPFKNLITAYNPIFSASNIMRDIPTALTYSDNPLKMSANVPKAVEEMIKNGKIFKKFKAMGGTREGLIGAGKEFKVPNLGESKKAFNNAQKINPIKKIGDVNNFTETLPRFAEFMTVLEKTGDPALALYKSAELTTDFSRHGKLTKLLDNFVPYLNPSVQGIDKFFREIKANPLKTAAKGAAAITVPTVILDQINKDNESYNNLTPRERNLYFNIPIPKSDKFLRIPKSRELGVAFSSLYEWAARASRGEKVTGEEIAQAVSENFTPTDITAPIWTPALKAFEQIKNPEAYETNYWGGLIVPLSQRKYSPGEQYDLNSSGIAKAIGQKLEISPFVIDYFLKSYGGIVSQVVQPIGAAKKVTPLAPLQKKFITDPVFKSQSVEEFYNALNVAKKSAQDYNKEYNIPSKTVTSLERKANALTKLSLQMSKIRAEQKRLQTKKGNEDRIRELQILINKTAKKGVEGSKR